MDKSIDDVPLFNFDVLDYKSKVLVLSNEKNSELMKKIIRGMTNNKTDIKILAFDGTQDINNTKVYKNSWYYNITPPSSVHSHYHEEILKEFNYKQRTRCQMYSSSDTKSMIIFDQCLSRSDILRPQFQDTIIESRRLNCGIIINVNNHCMSPLVTREIELVFIDTTFTYPELSDIYNRQIYDYLSFEAFVNLYYESHKLPCINHETEENKHLRKNAKRALFKILGSNITSLIINEYVEKMYYTQHHGLVFDRNKKEIISCRLCSDEITHHSK